MTECPPPPAPGSSRLATDFDAVLAGIAHFAHYPNLMPWVGIGYRDAPARVLILGESHYLDTTSTYHLDPERWYEGVDLADKPDRGWINTRGIIRRGLETRWKGRSKTIYRNLSAALALGGLGTEEPFACIAYMNYFQRPAELTGKSIKVSALDAQVSANTVAAVVDALRPQLVVFCSALSWRAAKRSGLLDALRATGVAVRAAAHPASAWWHKPSRRLKDRSGRESFLAALGEVMIAVIRP